MLGSIRAISPRRRGRSTAGRTREYEAYGVDGGQVEAMRRRLRAWAAEILDERIDER
jgi:hypothetical protein